LFWEGGRGGSSRRPAATGWQQWLVVRCGRMHARRRRPPGPPPTPASDPGQPHARRAASRRMPAAPVTHAGARAFLTIFQRAPQIRNSHMLQRQPSAGLEQQRSVHHRPVVGGEIRNSNVRAPVHRGRLSARDATGGKDSAAGRRAGGRARQEGCAGARRGAAAAAPAGAWGPLTSPERGGCSGPPPRSKHPYPKPRPGGGLPPSRRRGRGPGS
jgi:hypothetical protein